MRSSAPTCVADTGIAHASYRRRGYVIAVCFGSSCYLPLCMNLLVDLLDIFSSLPINIGTSFLEIEDSLPHREFVVFKLVL